METQELMLYVLTIINQVVAYGAFIYIAIQATKKNSLEQPKPQEKHTAKPQKPQRENVEEQGESKGKYLDYINKFEVET